MQIHEIQGVQLELLPEKAVYWPAEKTLLIADSHLGKIRHFRKAGIALPGSAGMRNLQQLEKLLKRYRPEQVIFLGDLFHSEMNYEWLQFKAFLENHTQTLFKLVQGNHDILHETSYRHFDLHTTPLDYGPFTLSHDPLVEHQRYNICGHVHPGVRMTGPARQSMRLPCYFFGERQAILPAFGVFTGLHLMKPDKGDRVYIIAGSEVMAAV